MNSLSLRVRKRQTHGFAAGGTYTYSKSMDNASTIGGGAVVVAQDDRNLDAEWGLSSFDQRHRFNADWSYELPFGPNRRWMTSGVPAAIAGGWMLSGTVQLASGTPFTARVLGDVTDVSRGSNGSLRADYTGAPVTLADPTVATFFNTAAFLVPPAGQFGDASRTIPGPGITNAGPPHAEHHHLRRAAVDSRRQQRVQHRAIRDDRLVELRRRSPGVSARRARADCRRVV